MERPKILLAIDGDIQSYMDALTRAGFEPLAADRESAARPDLAVIDCDLSCSRKACLTSGAGASRPLSAQW